jgi:hypothetical protein
MGAARPPVVAGRGEIKASGLKRPFTNAGHPAAAVTPVGKRMSGRTETHYEVQVLRDGRWLIEATSIDRDQAVADARELFARGEAEAVRVVDDRYDAGREIGASRIVHEQTRQRRPQRQHRPRRVGSGATPATGTVAAATSGTTRAAAASAPASGQAALALGLGLGAAALVVAAAIAIALVG